MTVENTFHEAGGKGRTGLKKCQRAELSLSSALWHKLGDRDSNPTLLIQSQLSYR